MPVRTEEMTSVIARTAAAVGRTSSSSPWWVESTVRWTELEDSAASWSWAPSQPSVPVLEAEAVSTASGRSPSVASAWAWVKTFGMIDHSSRWFR